MPSALALHHRCWQGTVRCRTSNRRSAQVGSETAKHLSSDAVCLPETQSASALPRYLALRGTATCNPIEGQTSYLPEPQVDTSFPTSRGKKHTRPPSYCLAGPQLYSLSRLRKCPGTLMKPQQRRQTSLVSFCSSLNFLSDVRCRLCDREINALSKMRIRDREKSHGPRPPTPPYERVTYTAVPQNESMCKAYRACTPTGASFPTAPTSASSRPPGLRPRGSPDAMPSFLGKRLLLSFNPLARNSSGLQRLAPPTTPSADFSRSFGSALASPGWRGSIHRTSTYKVTRHARRT